MKGQAPLPFPPIIGTGFVVRENGLIITNDHVVRCFPKLFRPPDVKDEWLVTAYMFKLSDKGMMQIPLEVLGVFRVEKFEPGNAYYGPPKPDIAFVKVKLKGLPALSVESSLEIKEGMEVGTAGFPMGTDALVAPGWLHQITPTLQRGIVSAVLPFACEAPHGFSINVMTQGGASGSPVFLSDTGKIVGVLYAGLNDIQETFQKDKYRTSTNISYVVPAHYITASLKVVEQKPDFVLPADTQSLTEIIAVAGSRELTGGHLPYEIRPIQPPQQELKVLKNLKASDEVTPV